jgi:hypothetical protein
MPVEREEEEWEDDYAKKARDQKAKRILDAEKAKVKADKEDLEYKQ